MTRIKQAAVYSGLLLFTLWPIVQIQLCLRYGVSPWKLGAWGMYAAPRIDETQFQLYARRYGRGEFEAVTELPQELYLVTWRFLDSYRWLRNLSRPDRLAAAIFDAHPEYEQLHLVVRQRVVDRQSAKVVPSSGEYWLSR